MKKMLLTAIISFVCISTPALAQQAGIEGQWRCRHGNQSVSNNNFENWIYQFDLAVNPGGNFQAYGIYTAATAGFDVQFQAQGNWQQSPQGVAFQGGEQRQDGTQQQFSLVFNLVAPNSMSQSLQTPYGNLASYCQR